MSAIKLNDNIFSVGVLNPCLKVFDIIMDTDYGTSYNAYLITGEKNILIDAVDNDYFEEYYANICEIIDINTVDYLIVNHTEQDHCGSVAKLLDLNPNIKIIGTFAAMRNLKEIINRDFNSETIKQACELVFGDIKLNFLPAPMLHWPDTMFTYYKDKKTVFTCDFLGCHFCETRMLDKFIKYNKQYEDSFAYYYKCIMAPFKDFVLKGIDILENLDIDMVCVSHGPVLTNRIETSLDLYKKWSTKEVKSKKSVLIAYVTAYKDTGVLANIAKQAFLDAGNFDVNMVDIIEHDINYVKELMEQADVLLIGSPTINRDALLPVWELLSRMDPIVNKGKVAFAFGSYGWSGEAVDMIYNRLKSLKIKVVEPGFKCVFVPNEEDKLKMKQQVVDLISTL